MSTSEHLCEIVRWDHLFPRKHLGLEHVEYHSTIELGASRTPLQLFLKVGALELGRHLTT